MPKTKIKLAVVDDHALFRNGLIGLLSDYKKLLVELEAENGIDFFKQLKRKNQVDVIILDLQMPEMDGFAVLKKLKISNPEIKVLVLTMHNEDEIIYELIELGAKGFLPKSAEIEEVVDAIHCIYDNDLYFNEEVSKKVIKKLAKKQKAKKTILSEALTNREKEIMKMICDEYTIKEIADKLFISDRTVDSHKKNIFEKTNTKNTAGIVMYSVRTGIVE